MPSPLTSHVSARVLAAVCTLALLLSACGEPAGKGPASDKGPAAGSQADPVAPAPAGQGGPSGEEGMRHAHEGEAPHGHDGDPGHSHEGDEIGPPPMDVGPVVRHGPHDGVVARLSRVDEPDFGFLELKLHDDKGDLELWLARDRDITLPFDLPLAAEIMVEFLDRKGRRVTLRVRDKTSNPDEDGKSNVRKGRTNYFIFPGETGEDARWLRGVDFESSVRVLFVHDTVAYVSDDFELRPHGLSGDHGHAHDEK